MALNRFLFILPLLLVATVSAIDKTQPMEGGDCFGGDWKSCLAYLAATLEVLVRGFALGFGARMLKCLLWDNESSNATMDKMGEQIRISMLCGLATTSFIFGSSLFLPAQMRINWFQYD